jgi:hypothetical protein
MRSEGNKYLVNLNEFGRQFQLSAISFFFFRKKDAAAIWGAD